MAATERRFPHPQVLLLGNGINRAFGGGSWGQLIREIAVNPALPRDCTLHLPMPLRAILVTGDTMNLRLREAGGTLYGVLGDEGHLALLRRLLEMDFDHILTTNFSYELEMAAQPDGQIREQELVRMMQHTDSRKKAEAKYLLHTYGTLAWNGHRTSVWHIHGEGRKPDSIILGHYYYANLLEKLMQYLRREEPRFRREQSRSLPLTVKSWADAFLFGDVYFLGFGCDVSEFDLWWLLNRKKKENLEIGETHFFAPAEADESGLNEKEELLKVLGVQVHHCEIPRPTGSPLERSLVFRRFYEAAMSEIQTMMTRRRVE